MLRATIREAVGEGNCEVVAIDVRCRRTSKLQVHGGAGQRQGRYCQTDDQHHSTILDQTSTKNFHNALTPDHLAAFTWLCYPGQIRTDRRTYHPDSTARPGATESVALPWQRQPTRPGSAPVEIMYRVGVGPAVRPPVTPGILGAMNGPIQIPEYAWARTPRPADPTARRLALGDCDLRLACSIC